jgi:hypothetical protein
MTTISNYLKQDKVTTMGLALILISTASFWLTGLYGRPDSAFGAFLVNYVISVGFGIAVVVDTIQKHGWHHSRGKAEHTAVLLVLSFISAFALNREMNVFDDSADWLSIWVVASSIALLLAMRHQWLGTIPRYFTFFFLGRGTAAVYLLRLLPAAIVYSQRYRHSGCGHFAAYLCAALPGYHYGRHHCSGPVARIRAVAVYGYRRLCAAADSRRRVPVLLGHKPKQINLIINQNTLNEGKLPATG